MEWDKKPDVNGWKLLHYIEELANKVEIMNSELDSLRSTMRMQDNINRIVSNRIHYLENKRTPV